MKNKNLYILALILTTISLGLFFYKHFSLKLPIKAEQETEVWTIESQITFEPQPNKPIKVEFVIPQRPFGYEVLNENFISRNYGVTTSTEGLQRVSTWSLRRASRPQTLYYRMVVYPTSENDSQQTDIPSFQAAPELSEIERAAVSAILDQVRTQSADISTMAREVVQRLNSAKNDNNIALLLGPYPTIENIVKVAQTILTSANIPVRIVHGIILMDQQRQAIPIPWLEVSNGQRWLSIDPNTGEPGRPHNFFPWWYNDNPVLTVSGGDKDQVEFSTMRNVYQTIDIARQIDQNSKLISFAPFKLPIQTQAIYNLLLLVPVGAFIVLFLRVFVGVQTFGTFMPVLIALAFRETELLGGIFMFSIIVALGLSVRFYLDRLKLLLMPRLTAVLITVILIMISLSVLSYQLNLDIGLSLALFPMVILVMTIERMSIVWEEKGPGSAIKQAIGSLFAALLAYLVMNITQIQYLVLIFPELLLILLAATILAGRYSGYRLTELYRFRSLTHLLKSDEK